MEALNKLDVELFFLINRNLSNTFFDFLLPTWTDFQKNPVFLLGLLPLFLAGVIYKRAWRLMSIIVIGFLATRTAGGLNHYLIKPFFSRARPIDSQLYQDVILRIPHPGSFSFPSGHAVDAFCMAVFLSFFYPKYRWGFLALAFLTALSRIYCGVHYPIDVTIGGLEGAAFGVGFYYLLQWFSRKNSMTKKWFFQSVCLFLVLFTQSAFAWKDPTEGKPFFPWAWEDQLKPTLKKSIDGTGVTILGTGVGSSLIVRQYDKNILRHNRDHGDVLIGYNDAVQFGKVGNGMAGVLIAAGQLYFDTDNGVRTIQAMFLTSTSHVATSFFVRRNRPDNRTDFLPWASSYPSGHTANAFAVAGSMAYSYGWKGGIPAYATAALIGLSRVKEDRHWASDVVAGAFLGTFWARAAFQAKKDSEEAVTYAPAPIFDGMMITASKKF
jgi:undecaprenyl-diphosphatase